jgi:plastocyanin
MRKSLAGVLLLTAVVAVLVTVGPIAVGSAEGRQLVGQFCTNPQAMPKPGACISLAYDGQTAHGYTGSVDRTIALRPGTYWVTVTDNSATHNFSLESPDGSDQDLTGVADTPGSVTFKVDLTHGTWTLFCDPHRAMGMYVLIEVGGEGQVG